MNEMHAANLKKLICKTVRRRYACSEKDLLQLSDIRNGENRDFFESLMQELIAEGKIVFMEFVNEDLPGTIRTIYFPAGTVFYEPGLSMKGRFLPDDVEKFYRKLISKGILEKEFFDDLDYSGKITYCDAILAYCYEQKITIGKLDRTTVVKILTTLVSKKKIVLGEV